MFLMKHYSDMEFVTSKQVSAYTIAELATEVARVVGFKGNIIFDASRPDGAPSEIAQVSKLEGLGWSPRLLLHDGLIGTYADFLAGGGRSTDEPVQRSVIADGKLTLCFGLFLLRWQLTAPSAVADIAPGGSGISGASGGAGGGESFRSLLEF